MIRDAFLFNSFLLSLDVDANLSLSLFLLHSFGCSSTLDECDVFWPTGINWYCFLMGVRPVIFKHIQVTMCIIWYLYLKWLGQSQWGFHRVLWALNMLTWYCLDEEREDKSFMGVERVSRGWNSSALFPKYRCVGNWEMKPSLRLALEGVEFRDRGCAISFG